MNRRRIVLHFVAAVGMSLLVAGCQKKEAPASLGKRYAVEVLGSTVRVTPSGGWKMNLEYDHRFEGKLAPTGADVRVDKAKGKVTDDEVVLPVPLAAGQSAEGSVFFAICTAKKCVPLEEKVKLSAK